MKLFELAQTTFYHVTRTQSVDKIKRQGITHFNPSNWIQAGSKERYGEGEIFAFENERDALRWAAKMDWEFNKQMGSGNISIIAFHTNPNDWKEDVADPLGQAATSGKWLKSHTTVKPEDIVASYPVSADRLKMLVQS